MVSRRCACGLLVMVLQSRQRRPGRRVDRRGQEDWLQGNAEALTLQPPHRGAESGAIAHRRFRPAFS